MPESQCRPEAHGREARPCVEVDVQWPSDTEAEGFRGAGFDAYDRHLGTLACVLASPWSTPPLPEM
jgi:hypothetical protein